MARRTERSSFLISRSESRIASVGAPVLFCFILLATIPRTTAAQVKHFGLTSTDTFRSCAAGVFGKPVLIDMAGWGPRIETVCQSGETPAELKEALESKGELVSDGSAFVYLTPLSLFKTYYGSEDRKISITWAPANGRVPIPGCPPLVGRDLASVGAAVLREARMPFFPAGTLRGSQSGPLAARLPLDLYDCPLKPGIESVFGVLGGARLVFGEMRDHQFHLVWDSPEFVFVGGGGYVSELRDMNGDGVKEILVGGNQSGASQVYEGLEIFDTEGNELDPGDDSFIAEQFEYLDLPDGKVDVLVKNNDRTDRYTLVNGHYVPWHPKRPPRKAGTQPPKP
jgi:hypothetical protein